MLITTAPSGDPGEAAELAARFGLSAEERGGRTLPALLQAAQGAPVLVLGAHAADLYLGKERFRAGAGMAFLRLRRALQGEVDPLVRAAGLLPGDRVLDCTLGLGGDALVAAQAAAGVVSIEVSPLLAAFTTAGLRRLPEAAAGLCERIEIRLGDHRALLREMPARSFDVVLFDPMFRTPKESAPLFQVLRAHAEHALLEEETVEAARRVARRGVLVKDAWPGRELVRLGLRPLPARRLPRILFGWADAKEE